MLAVEAVSVYGLKEAINEQIQQLPPEVGKGTDIKEINKGVRNRLTEE